MRQKIESRATRFLDNMTKEVIVVLPSDTKLLAKLKKNSARYSCLIEES